MKTNKGILFQFLALILFNLTENTFARMLNATKTNIIEGIFKPFNDNAKQNGICMDSFAFFSIKLSPKYLTFSWIFKRF